MIDSFVFPLSPILSIHTIVYTGVMMIDLCTSHNETEPSAFIDLSALANPSTGSSANDFVFYGPSNDLMFVTDYLGGYLWEVSGRTQGSNAKTSIYTTFDPSFGPNGIETIDHYLLLSLAKVSKLIRIDVTTGGQREVALSPPTVLLNGDGMKFDQGKQVLYVARHSYNSVVALVSCNEWLNATIAVDFDANCMEGTDSGEVTTIALTPTSSGTNLWVFCSDAFGPGPYTFNRIVNVSSNVYSGSLACGGSLDTDTDTGGRSSNEDNSFVSRTVFWSVIVVCIFLLVVAVAEAAVAYRFYRMVSKDRSDGSAIPSTTPLL
jgi:hypothetical protein